MAHSKVYNLIEKLGGIDELSNHLRQCSHCSMTDRPFTLDLIWGAKAIGEACGLTEGAAKYMLVNRELPGRKVGGKWVASREALRLFFMDRERAA